MDGVGDAQEPSGAAEGGESVLANGGSESAVSPRMGEKNPQARPEVVSICGGLSREVLTIC
jgi:hypothetical protein